MRWVFFSLLILNVVYGVWRLALGAAPAPEPVSRAMQTAPETLKLISEVPAERLQRRFAGQGGSLGGLCPAVGPFSEPSEANQVLNGLRGAGYSGQVRAVRVERDRLHWVFLPAYPTRDEAMKVLRELQSRGVDSFVVAEGEDANAISLGYFSSEESARGLRVKMETSGYPASVRATAKEVTEYWLFIPADAVSDDGAALRDLLAAREALVGEQVACDSQAVQERQLQERYQAELQAAADATADDAQAPGDSAGPTGQGAETEDTD